MKKKRHYEPKPLFVERMKKLLGDDYDKYIKILEKEPVRSIRCNTLKISPEELLKKLGKKGWTIKQPFDKHPEIMIIENKLEPGEIGRALEHLLGYYYVQEIASMLPILVLKPEKDQLVLDLCAAPGSKTTQAAAKMQNTGTIIANEVSMGRIKILVSNLEKCGVTNTIVTKKEGYHLCNRLRNQEFQFDKILVDAPCSGEGTLRSTPKTFKIWNIKSVRNLSKIQKNLLVSAVKLIRPGGEIVYSTCTHSPEENEEVLDYILREFPNIKIEKISLPVKTTKGIKKWQDKEYLEDVKYACRIYPHISDTEGFFIAKLRKEK